MGFNKQGTYLKLKEADIIRAFAIVSIVFYHCVLCPICIWEPPLIEQNRDTALVKSLTDFFMPEANMLLFVALSGYLFGFSVQSHKDSYGSFTDFFKRKGHRLLIPFIVLGTLANLAVPDRPLKDILWGSGSSLWFCLVLFWCFLLRWIALNSSRIFRISIFLISLFTYVALVSNYHYPKKIEGFPLGLLGFDRSFYFYIPFMLGEYLYRYKHTIVDISLKILSFFGILYAFLAYFSLQDLGIFSYVCLKVYPLLLIYFTFAIVSRYSERLYTMMGGVHLSRFCYYSFGIYVFHEEIAWDCYYHIPFFRQLFVNYPFVTALVFFLFTLLLCYVATHYCLKTKVGKYLLT